MSKLLTPRQQAFVRQYFFDFNATRAAKRAGYGGSDASLAVIGSQNLKKDHIRQAIRDHLEENSISIEEIIYRLTCQARASIKDFIRFDQDGKWIFDIHKATDTGAVDQVEKLVFFTSKKIDGTHKRHLHIKLYNAQNALIQLGKAYGLSQGKLDPLERPEGHPAVSAPPLLEDQGE